MTERGSIFIEAPVKTLKEATDILTPFAGVLVNLFQFNLHMVNMHLKSDAPGKQIIHFLDSAINEEKYSSPIPN